jgi:hypothetical protein
MSSLVLCACAGSDARETVPDSVATDGTGQSTLSGRQAETATTAAAARARANFVDARLATT